MNGAGRRNAGTVRKKRERLGAARRSSATSARIGGVEPAAEAPAAAAPAGAEGAGELCSGAALPWPRPGALGSVEPGAAGKVVVSSEKVSRTARDDAAAASPTHPSQALGSLLARSGGPAGRVSGRTPAVGAPAAV